jgi:capsular polysaccharide biosynthesis protein
MEEEISLIEIGHTLLKRWKLLLFLPLLAAALVYGISNLIITPQYQSSATLIVMPFTEADEGSGVIRHDIASTRQVVLSCKELTLSHDSLQRIINELNLPYSQTDLRDNINITVEDITTVSVTDSNPTRAFEISVHITNVLMEFITETAQLENVQLLNPAQVPASPVNQRTTLNITVAFILAFMISTVLVFILEHLDNTIKTADDIQKHLGVPVLGAIPEFEEEKR